MTAAYAAVIASAGFALAVGGIAIIYWPAALIAGGLLLLGFGLTADTT